MCDSDCRNGLYPIVVNTTPHMVAVMRTNGRVTFASDAKKTIRCEQAIEPTTPLLACDVARAGAYVLAETPEWVKEVDAIIVSTIVAGCAAQLRELNPKLRILVPDSGPSAVRDDKGRIMHVVRFLEY